MSAQHRPPAAVPFAFGGRPSLDLTWTLRYRAVQPTELLTTPAMLSEWLAQSGLPNGRATTAHLSSARELRESIYACALAALADGAFPVHDVAEINRWAEAELSPLHMRADGTTVRRVARGHETATGIADVARDAIAMFSAKDGRIRKCEGPRCSLLFHDASRPGTRRWCATERCGNKVNTKNYRNRNDP